MKFAITLVMSEFSADTTPTFSLAINLDLHLVSRGKFKIPPQSIRRGRATRLHPEPKIPKSLIWFEPICSRPPDCLEFSDDLDSSHLVHMKLSHRDVLHLGFAIPLAQHIKRLHSPSNLFFPVFQSREASVVGRYPDDSHNDVIRKERPVLRARGRCEGEVFTHLTLR